MQRCLPNWTRCDPHTPTAPRVPHLPHHGLGQDLGPARPAQQVGCLQEDLRPVRHRLQVPLLPGSQGGPNGSVEQGLMKRERLGATSHSSKGARGAIRRDHYPAREDPRLPPPDSGRRWVPQPAWPPQARSLPLSSQEEPEAPTSGSPCHGLAPFPLVASPSSWSPVLPNPLFGACSP